MINEACIMAASAWNVRNACRENALCRSVVCRIWFIITHKYTDGYVAHGFTAYSTSMDSKPYRHSYGISYRVNGSRLKYWLNQPDTNLILIQGCMKSHTIFSNSIDFVAKSGKHYANLYVYNILQVYISGGCGN